MISSKNPLIGDILKHLSIYSPVDDFPWLQNTGLTFCIRPLNLMQDLPVIHQWVNQEYALPFWGMNGFYTQLFDTYQSIRLSTYSESLTGWLDDQLICQLDLYDPAYDAIRNHYTYQPGDVGFHLLMAPGKRLLLNSTAKIVWYFLQLFFHSPHVNRIIGEPDARNEKARRMLEQLHFEYFKNLTLSDKEASFYTLTRLNHQQRTLVTQL